MGQCRIRSAVIRGVEAIPVDVEVSIASGMVGMHIVGMADTAVQEARERVRSAIRACGFSVPGKRIVINLAPSSLKKGGSGFDVPIAIGILIASGQLSKEVAKDRLFVGELSLNGSVKHVAGTLAYGICAKRIDASLVSNGEEPVPIEGLKHFALKSLNDLRRGDVFDDEKRVANARHSANADAPDFSDVMGHESAKRAAQIAVAGEHGLLMSGPPGSGKTMIAQRIASIMPPLTQAEILEAAVIHSVAEESIESILSGVRPFRHPHHSATMAGLLGGGTPLRPGEVSLAHRGTLFLDELPEFKPSTLQGLRQPMESGKVSLTRADGNVEFPARFMLVAAANPCPCGYYGDSAKPCTCTLPQIRTYQGRVGGPLLDRIDIQLDIRRLPPEQVMQTGHGTDSRTLREGVLKAREYRSFRERDHEEEDNTSDMLARPQAVVASCALKHAEEQFMVEMARAHSLSGRALISCLRVARTIADMEQVPQVTCEHLAEALGFRVRTR